MFCGNCGHQNGDADAYCTACGQKIQAAQAVSSTGAAVAPAIERTASLAAPDSKLNGVRGWLFLFCLGALILTPLVLTAEALAEGNLFVYLIDVPLAALSFVIGLNIVRRNEFVFKLLKPYFGAYFALGAITMILLIIDSSSNFQADNSKDIASSFRMMIFSAVWFSYFKQSKRVLATFGRNL